ncbi:EscE/YscE/SsaE family type III secretion system needle protein co-chaperone [Vibrio agarivorans]|uniref:EscE/YscE/SsaE family type III secretion system needle protein co-chaperone n=2 Tax=Vibrio sagamiensis TaxID=512650 RepID=A0A511QDP7_9VIBR|nr:EscE/YscE/SsaE family type III secretion system needle protein co-chaperone [Vibrio sagamiensis]PNQ56785.1 EscE/YscE/SsaE family type III secretion system needle protein co-chaperone [Vibrio agarivorans]GEM75431.1 hypothetical protein VSA01S_15430 [Vibrio sagamiensis NBRC 104589]
MTNLEEILDNDIDGKAKHDVVERLNQAQLVVKRKLDIGCSPKEYQLLMSQYEAYQAAKSVIEQY